MKQAPPLSDERKQLLRRRLREAIKQQPEIRTLRRILLDLGGIELVAPPAADSLLGHLIERGFVMSGPVTRNPMTRGACHDNMSRLWMLKNRAIVGIGTGYALSGDGLWRQHSWGIRREGILETTVPREKYFGVLLQGSKATCFAQSTST
jgi:hypothetical protein